MYLVDRFVFLLCLVEIRCILTYVLSSLTVNRPVQTLLIDNYDSYTYNIWQQVAEINGIEPIVIHNNAFSSWPEMLQNLPDFDNIIISPGPGRPENSNDFGLCKAAIEQGNMPLLGVCLGHQGMGWLYGGKVIKAPTPMHGRKSRIFHNGKGLFENIPNGFEVVRYHSLLVDQLPSSSPLLPTAWTSDSLLMGVEHTTRPQYGVQFHPESVSTEYGKMIFKNFHRLTIDYYLTKQPKELDSSRRQSFKPISFFNSKCPENVGPQSWKKYVYIETVDVNEAGSLFNMTELVSKLHHPNDTVLWLDSETFGPTDQQKQVSRTSYFMAIDTPSAYSLQYSNYTTGTKLTFGDGKEKVTSDHILSYLNEQLKRDPLYSIEYINKEGTSSLPFIDGYFGYFGYELGKEIAHILSNQNGLRQKIEKEDFQLLQHFNGSNRGTASIPLTFLLSPSRYIAYQHQERKFYIVSFQKTSTGEKDIRDTVFKEGEELKERLMKAIDLQKVQNYEEKQIDARQARRPTLFARKSSKQYEEDIAQCLEYIKEGETYEVCLTVQFHGTASPSPRNSSCIPLEIYRKLREFNPAPYSAYLSTDQFAVCCTSPEQYLKLTKDKIISSKPIKGTSKRDLTDPLHDHQLALRLQQDEKSQAENLMIVDLVRNDLGRVCEVGTVTVPSLMNVESYATVHQLVSTIQGNLSSNYNIIDAIMHTFPGGSMTGAPKLRTMEIIEELEQQPRGIYSGTMGFIGSNGVADLNIIIRTAVLNGDQITIGAGGAIVAQSNPKEEMEEVLLKAKAVGSALGYNVEFSSD